MSDPTTPGTAPLGRRQFRQAERAKVRPLISVVTVVRNEAEIIERAIASVARQRRERVEYIVIDGASTDGTLDLICRHDTTIDKWISEPDAGIYDAMNKALQLATGDWLIFLGADDQLLADLDSLSRRFTQANAVYYGNVLIQGCGRVSGGAFSRYRLMQENICHQAVFYPRSAYTSKSYDTRSGMLADHRYNIEIRGGGVPFIHVNETISSFNDAGLSSKGDSGFESIKLAAIRESFGLLFYLTKRARTALVNLVKRQPDVTA